MTTMDIGTEAFGVLRSLWYAEGNNNARKTVMLIFLGLFVLNAVLLMLGKANLADPHALELWMALFGGFMFLWGQNSRDETRRRRKRKGVPEDED